MKPNLSNFKIFCFLILKICFFKTNFKKIINILVNNKITIILLLGFFGYMFFLSKNYAYSATVKRKLAKRSVVIIDEGSSSGIKKTDEVCFYDKDDEEIGCGNVRRVKIDKAFVKVEMPLFKKIRKGQVASYSSSMADGGPGSSDDHFLNLRLSGNFTFFQPYKIAYPKYKSNKAPFWEPAKSELDADEKIVDDGVYVNFEVELIQFFATMGFRFYVLEPNGRAQTNYVGNSNDANHKELCETHQQGSKKDFPKCYIDLDYSTNIILGGYLQFMYPVMLSEGIFYKTGLGIDLNYSSLKFDADLLSDHEKHKNTKTALLQDVDSSAYVFSARLVPVHVAMDIAPGFSIFLESSFLFGLFSFGNKTESSKKNYITSDTNVAKSSQRKKDEEDYVPVYLHESLDHSNQLFGLNVGMGIQLSF